METLILKKKQDGQLIEKWEDWTPPKRDYHWKAGRSAMELAKAWFSGKKIVVPCELSSLMQTELRLKELKLIQGIPELVTCLPEKGEGRNHDLALTGNTPSENITICIEAKADESFGNHTVYEYLKSAEERQATGIRTGVPKRIKALLAMVGQSDDISSSTTWGSIRYQLLTATCGTVLQAKHDKSSLAVFVVHEFRTNSTTKKKLDKNHIEFEKLLLALSSNEVKVEQGKLYGPFLINGVDLMLGKIVSIPQVNPVKKTYISSLRETISSAGQAARTIAIQVVDLNGDGKVDIDDLKIATARAKDFAVEASGDFKRLGKEALQSDMAKDAAAGAVVGAVIAVPVPLIGPAGGAVVGAGFGVYKNITKKK